MLAQRRFRLVTLGRLELSSSAGETFHVEEVRPRHLAVLAVLALSNQPVRREMLVDMFWGGETDDRARHTLSNALSALRAVLGPKAISSRNETVALDDDARLEVDALQFAAACEVRDDERAVALYGGPFLGDVHVPDAATFDRWSSRERGRFAREFQQACERHVPAMLRSGRYQAAATAAERWLESAPESTLAFTTLLRARAANGTAASIMGALAEFDRLRDSLWREHERKPHDAVLSLVAELRQQLATAQEREERQHAGATAPTVVSAPPRAVDSPVSVQRPRRRMPTAAAVVLAIGLFAGGVAWLKRGRPLADAAESRRPVIAITSIDDVAGDTSVAWLRAGLPRLIANDLDATGGIEVVPPSRVRDVTERLSGSTSARVTEAQAIDIGRRLGATWVVVGGVSLARGGYLLDVTLRQTGTPEGAQSFTVLSPDLMELGRLAATRLATAVNAQSGVSGAQAQYAEVATANPVSYRYFVRAMLAIDAGRFSEGSHDLDSAIARDSGFVDAVRMRRQFPDRRSDSVLARLETKYASRLSEFERRYDEIRGLDSLGEKARAAALSEQLLARLPHDPRVYSLRADLLMGRDHWAEAEQVLLRELALDSLAMSAGNGPCTPCEVLWRLSQVRLAQGNPVAALDAARHWTKLQPDLPAAWRNLTATAAATGHAAEAVDAGSHLLALSSEESNEIDYGRSMLAARRYEIVDSLLGAWKRTQNPELIAGGRDLKSLLERERGQFSASLATLAGHSNDGSALVLADNLARLGRQREANDILEHSGHQNDGTLGVRIPAAEARGFAWAHALEADQRISRGDTSGARAMIDSLARVGQQSYYGRDHLLFRHVQGLLYFAEHRYAEAERELRAAEWSASSWTRTNVELARAELAQGHTSDALTALREAYLAPLDGMGRYVPHSELDWWMSRAFAAAGQTDSARVYATYVRSAWRHGDASSVARLDSILR